MLIWTHRGNPGPENTIEAFSQAWLDGIRFFETDVHSTKDGILVLAHDSDISRLSGKSLRIKDITFQELEKYKIAGRWSWARLETLVERFPEATISVDIKSDDALEPFIQWASTRDLQNLVVGSFSAKRTLAIRKAFPSARTALTTVEILAINLGVMWLLEKFSGPKIAMIPVNYKGIPIFTRRFRRYCRSKNIQINIWTINDPLEAKCLIELGASGIITDNYLDIN